LTARSTGAISLHSDAPLVGFVVWILGQPGSPGLPGDIERDADDWRINMPIVTGLVASIVPTSLVNMSSWSKELAATLI
jgi:hypothetical protein